ncbi:unnamed protein product [Adineta ricciae]|uniref:Uncharacterized protein n=1 Tax=Adineta ricciae TaxID=249248 RepID=A0A815KDL3_ADIRI|nr:unnamed protein product [Adineta ricciae]
MEKKQSIGLFDRFLDVDKHVHHLSKKRELGCNCFSGWSCHNTLYYNAACGCMICGSGPVTVSQGATTASRCDKNLY